jgi:hypothetical protein
MCVPDRPTMRAFRLFVPMSRRARAAPSPVVGAGLADRPDGVRIGGAGAIAVLVRRAGAGLLRAGAVLGHSTPGRADTEGREPAEGS